MKSTLTTRDFINIGVFTVIYVIIFFGLGMLGIISPQMMLVGFAIAILIDGYVITLLLARSPKMFTLTILGFLTAIVMLLTGHPWFLIIITPVLGLIADLIATRGGAAKRLEPTRAILAYAVFTLWGIFPLLPMFFAADDYFDKIGSEMSVEYADSMRQFFTVPVFVGWCVTLFILALAGGWLGVKAWNKHFKRAGLSS